MQRVLYLGQMGFDVLSRYNNKSKRSHNTRKWKKQSFSVGLPVNCKKEMKTFFKATAIRTN